MKEKSKTYQTAVIDGHTLKVRPEQTILDAAMKAGIYIPTLCYLEKLPPYGGCRLCVVKVKGMRGFPTACTTPLVPGMEIETITPELQKLRREILEFTLSEHPFTCLVCKDKKECTDFMHTTRKVSTITGCNFCTSNGDCELQELVDYLELDQMKFPITYRGIPPVKDNPFYDLDYNLCVLCGRCVRICNEERHSHVLAFVERGSTAIVGTAFNESQADAGCEFCGACVDVCPTGSISEKMGKWRDKPDRSVKTTCLICPVACEMHVNTSRGKLVQIGPPPGSRTSPDQLCLQGKFLPAEINDHPSRITSPLIRREDKWIEVPWEKALNLVAGEFIKHKGEGFGLIASGQDTLEDNYMLQRFSRTVMKSNNLDMHHSYPGKTVPELLHRMMRSNVTGGLADLEQADTILLLGMDASISHPMLENLVRKAFHNGQKVINLAAYPTRTDTFITSGLHYLPGGEEALMHLLLSALSESPSPGEKIRLAEENSGISMAELEPVTSMLEGSKKVTIVAGEGLLRQPSSEAIIRIIASLQANLNGGRSCKILFPGYGGNLYSGALVGVHPGYLPGFQPVSREKTGMARNEMIRNTGTEGITAMMVVGDLPRHPNLGNLEFLVQCNMFRTELTEYANVLLPVTDFLETTGHIMSLDGKLKKLNMAVTPPGSARSISRIVSGLAGAMGEKGFSHRPVDIFRELKPQLEEPVSDKKNLLTDDVDDRGGKGPGKSKEYPVRMVILHPQFSYRGTRLNGFVPDLEIISHEGTVRLSESLMVQLKLNHGEKVRITSENGSVDSVVSAMAGINSPVACFSPNGGGHPGVPVDLYPENQVVFVKIEKV